MTNQQIAAKLFLSEKTIESHIRNVFNKLGVSSRVEVARVVEHERRERTPAGHAVAIERRSSSGPSGASRCLGNKGGPETRFETHPLSR